MAEVSLPIGLLLQMIVPLLTIVGVWVAITNRVTRLEERTQLWQKAVDRENEEIRLLLVKHSEMLQEILLKLENKQNRQ
ncbi:MAG: hypothetical protein LCH58_06070 [Bacteroidetes bacterium]|uniref:hypothetical protein n=1 Tax=Phnomibacter sp. TaxID=2836217 RepID=UPI002FDD8ED1|nr:hypothetical protein [Bacteroidota bacterium]